MNREDPKLELKDNYNSEKKDRPKQMNKANHEIESRFISWNADKEEVKVKENSKIEAINWNTPAFEIPVEDFKNHPEEKKAWENELEENGTREQKQNANKRAEKYKNRNNYKDIN